MASPSAVEIIDTALFCTTIFGPSYTDPDQKWLIRDHLLSLHREFPSLHLTMAPFVHNDGTMVNLLKAEGFLHLPRSLPPVPISIWVHENYPHMAPMVQVSSNQASQLCLRANHPFVDSSGVLNSSYLQTWEAHGCSLLGLVHNLVKLFLLDHPFCFNTCSLSHPSYVSRMEGMDRLWCMAHYDLLAMKENIKEEMEKLAGLQAEMSARGDFAASMIIGLDNERMKLKGRVRELTKEADVVRSWVAANEAASLSMAMGEGIEGVFECVGEDSRLVLELVAEYKGLEDLMDKLEKGLEAGVVSFQVYLKQVRSLAREQFFIKAKLVKLKGPQILQWVD